MVQLQAGSGKLLPVLMGRNNGPIKAALYTYIEDKVPGEMRGHSMYDIAEVDGNDAAIARTKYLAESVILLVAPKIYWSVAKP